MNSRRSQLIDLIEHGAIAPEHLQSAVERAGLFPDRAAWSQFLDRLLWFMGALSLAASLVFFIAYNWDRFGRFAKFGLVEVSVVLAILAFMKLDANKLGGKVMLLLASLLLGVLLALYGQTYQTGADSWQLFFNWALLITPWVVISRLPALWLMWLGLFNLSLVLYHDAFGTPLEIVFDSDTSLLWWLVLLNLPAQVMWELAARRWAWLDARWAVRLIAVGVGTCLTVLMVFAIVEHHHQMTELNILVWLIWLAALLVIYRKIIPDLFMLAGLCLSAIVVVTTFLGKHMLDGNDPGAFLLLAMMVIGMGSAAAFWLRKMHREMSA